MTYEYFGHHHSRQQESWEEALWAVRDFHHQALATAAMLEGHIEWLSHSISQGQHGSQRQSGSCHQLGSRRCSRSHGHLRSHIRHLPARPQGQTAPVEGNPGDAARKWVDSSALCDPGGRWTHQHNPEDGQPHPALCGPGGGSSLKMQVQTPVQK